MIGKHTPRRRQSHAGLTLVLGLAAACGLAACSSAPKVLPGEIGAVSGFFGGVAADEPRAALIARDTLSAGGTAADAAVALYFALSATLPSAAGLGGGGACVGYEPADDQVYAISFLPGTPAGAAAPGGLDMALPGNVRGMYALHARGGRLRWQQLVFPAERLARFGFPATRALTAGLASAELSPDVRARFAPDGRPVGEGAMVRELDLAASLGRIRLLGAGDLYTGVLARRLVEAARAAGAAMTADELRQALPLEATPVQLDAGIHKVAFASTEAGRRAAAVWQAIHGPYRTASESAREAVLANGLAQAGIAIAQPLPALPHATSFAVADREGNIVSCGVTMGRPFGTGRVVGDTGIFAAPAHPPGGWDEAAQIAAMVMTNTPTKEAYLALGAAGPGAIGTMVATALRLYPGGQPLDRAMSFPEATPPARVNAVWCAEGLRDQPQSCAADSDPRGAGLAVMPEPR